ncbi:MAG: LCP family protein [Parcubacteria group bacterium]|nr:LCP family protein [Parcubacteria group bacterium]
MNQPKQINRLIEKGLFNEQLKKQKHRKKNEKKLRIACLIISTLIIFSFLVLFYQLIPSSEISINNEPNKNKTGFNSILSLAQNKENKPAMNVLILGRPGQGYSGQDLTDTIILAHIEPDKGKAVLISLPRDLLVQISNQGALTKINSLYARCGIECLKEKVQGITGLSVDHYVLIDLAVVKEVIELVDGLNVYVPKDINDPYFPGPNYSYQTFNLSAGWRYLNGDTALKYVRTRYTSPNGDFDRMARQQQIIQLLKQKVLDLNPLWDLPTYLKIFNTLNDHIKTDLGLLEIKSFWQIAKDIGSDEIISLVIDKKETNLLIGGQVMFDEQKASVVYPKAGQGNYEEIKEYIKKAIKDSP